MLLKKLLSSKTPIHFIAYAVCLVGLIADILFLVLDGSDQTFTIGCFVCVILGSVLGLADFFFGWENLLLWLSSLLYAAAIGFHLSVALPSLSDWWNGINFVGGNQELALTFGILFLAVDLVLIVLNFFETAKK